MRGKSTDCALAHDIFPTERRAGGDDVGATEGLYVRGVVKARRPLMNGLKDKLEAVNDLTAV